MLLPKCFSKKINSLCSLPYPPQFLLTCHVETQEIVTDQVQSGPKLSYSVLFLPQAYDSLHICMNLLKLSTLYPRLATVMLHRQDTVHQRALLLPYLINKRTLYEKGSPMAILPLPWQTRQAGVPPHKRS